MTMKPCKAIDSTDADACSSPLQVFLTELHYLRGDAATKAGVVAILRSMVGQRMTLTLRDRSGDERVSCTECAHYRPGRCSNHRAARPHSPEVGSDLAELLQRCPGFQRSTASGIGLAPLAAG